MWGKSLPAYPATVKVPVAPLPSETVPEVLLLLPFSHQKGLTRSAQDLEKRSTELATPHVYIYFITDTAVIGKQ